MDESVKSGLHAELSGVKVSATAMFLGKKCAGVKTEGGPVEVKVESSPEDPNGERLKGEADCSAVSVCDNGRDTTAGAGGGKTSDIVKVAVHHSELLATTRFITVLIDVLRLVSLASHIDDG